MSRRVVVTGLGSMSPLGTNWKEVREKLQNNESGVSYCEEWEEYDGIESLVSGDVNVETDRLMPDLHPRKRRAMGRVALLSVAATERALEDAGLLGNPVLTDGRTGVSYGSTEGSQEASAKFTDHVLNGKSIKGVKLSDYLASMTHTSPANLARHYEVRGRLISTSTACTSASQGIGYGYEAISSGKQDVMITGGAEEQVISAAAVFNIMFGASTRNDQPSAASRPFDADRDGLVVSEGAGTMILEERDHAIQRGADIYGEIVGFSCLCNGDHLTIPTPEGMTPVMKKALEDARLTSDQIGYVNAHATATIKGDIAESIAVHDVLGPNVPISSLKSFTGHTLGGCGAIEANYALRMACEGWLAPNLNLETVDDECADLNYIQHEPLDARPEYIMTNSFAFGGVNTSIILKPMH